MTDDRKTGPGDDAFGRLLGQVVDAAIGPGGWARVVEEVTERWFPGIDDSARVPTAAAGPGRRGDVYVSLSDRIARPPGLHTRSVAPEVNLDLDADGEVVGVEVLSAVAVTVDGREVPIKVPAPADTSPFRQGWKEGTEYTAERVRELLAKIDKSTDGGAFWRGQLDAFLAPKETPDVEDR